MTLALKSSWTLLSLENSRVEEKSRKWSLLSSKVIHLWMRDFHSLAEKEKDCQLEITPRLGGRGSCTKYLKRFESFKDKRNVYQDWAMKWMLRWWWRLQMKSMQMIWNIKGFMSRLTKTYWEKFASSVEHRSPVLLHFWEALLGSKHSK